MTDSSTYIQRISALSPKDFENFVYDCMSLIGIKNLVWRTPGSDSGRDIEGEVFVRDVSGFEDRQSWYIECKKHSRSIGWPIIWDKIGHANCLGADVLFVVSNNNPSPNCESLIAEWNSKKNKPTIRIWRGYDFPPFLRANPSLAFSYGLQDDQFAYKSGVGQMASILMSITQSAYSAYLFDQSGLIFLETAAALTELMSHRIADLENHGKFVCGPNAEDPLQYSWLKMKGAPTKWEDVSIRTILTYVHHLTNCEEMCVEFCDDIAFFDILRVRDNIDFDKDNNFREILLWCRAELLAGSEHDKNLAIRQRS